MRRKGTRVYLADGDVLELVQEREEITDTEELEESRSQLEVLVVHGHGAEILGLCRWVEGQTNTVPRVWKGTNGRTEAAGGFERGRSSQKWWQLGERCCFSS